MERSCLRLKYVAQAHGTILVPGNPTIDNFWGRSKGGDLMSETAGLLEEATFVRLAHHTGGG